MRTDYRLAAATRRPDLPRSTPLYPAVVQVPNPITKELQRTQLITIAVSNKPSSSQNMYNFQSREREGGGGEWGWGGGWGWGLPLWRTENEMKLNPISQSPKVVRWATDRQRSFADLLYNGQMRNAKPKTEWNKLEHSLIKRPPIDRRPSAPSAPPSAPQGIEFPAINRHLCPSQFDQRSGNFLKNNF